ncbi:hypothetical protein AKJ09_07976 [Labilithrix luteola]|uniref:Lcl C-terminal domain-containing protein n=1 Tax=Labilithrix luteola TaxID=1391654 RepID=A0A0K1Q6F5_9BACT|nr:hypothetical protein AKJ09_07976 [Labilithrix luteola]
MLALPAIAACNSIIGLDQFTEGQCAGGRCPGPTGEEAGTDVNVPETSRPDVVTETGPGVSRVTWAKWIMPNDDASATSDNLLSYDEVGGVVTDKITSLVWQAASSPTPLDFEGARRFCQDQTGSWRLPSRIELVTLLDLRGQKKVAPPFENGTQLGPYWTSSEVRPVDTSGTTYWIVDFVTGHVRKQSPKETSFYVRCVRGGS